MPVGSLHQHCPGHGDMGTGLGLLPWGFRDPKHRGHRAAGAQHPPGFCGTSRTKQIIQTQGKIQRL